MNDEVLKKITRNLTALVNGQTEQVELNNVVAYILGDLKKHTEETDKRLLALETAMVWLK